MKDLSCIIGITLLIGSLSMNMSSEGSATDPESAPTIDEVD